MISLAHTCHPHCLLVYGRTRLRIVVFLSILSAQSLIMSTSAVERVIGGPVLVKEIKKDKFLH